MLFGANRVTVAAVLLVAASGLTGRSAQSQDPNREKERPSYQIVAKGLLANPAFSVQFHSAPLRVGIRDLIMGPGQAQSVPTPVRTLMELRGGGVITIINGESQQRQPGDFWIVERGSALSLQNDGDVAVIRAIQLFEGQ
jgi:hypothetical protein